MVSTFPDILFNLSSNIVGFLRGVQSHDDFESLLFRYGFLLDIEENALEAITPFQNLTQAFIQFNETLSEWIDDEEIETEEEEQTDENKADEKDWKDYLKALYPLIKDIYKAIIALKDLNEEDLDLLGLLDDPKARAEFKKEFPEHLIEDIFTLTLQRHYPLAYGFFLMFGIIEYTEEEPTGEYRVNYTRTNIRWGRLAEFLGGPGDLFNEVYHWDGKNGAFQWEKLLHNIERAFLANRFLMRYVLPRKSVVDPGDEGDEKPFRDYVHPEYMVAHELHELQLPFIYGTSVLDESFYNVSLAMMPIGRPGELEQPPQGLLFTPIIQGSTEHSFFISPEVALKLAAGLDATNAVGIALFPDTADLILNAPETGLSIGLEGSPYAPWVIFGDVDSHRLELHGFELSLSVAGEIDDPEVKIAFKATSPDPESRGIQAYIDLGESDSFLQETTERDSIEAGFDLEIEWSNKHGFRFGGSVGFDLQYSLNRKIGPIELSNLYVNLGEGPAPEPGKPQSTRLSTGLGINGKLGPIQFYVEDIGMALDLTPYNAADLQPGDEPPLLGVLDVGLDFSPPRGIGFVIDVSAVKGGGYLEYNAKTGRYLGQAELTISDKFTVKAIGIIDTRLPKGKSGYSFLLIITTEFEPVQLGFGFTLEGVGGLVGLHRTMSIEAITERVRWEPPEDEDHAFDQVLFPQDPINDLPGIVSTLDQLFPIAQDQYTFGIMGKLGWGSPKLIDIQAGLILTSPNFAIALIGTAKSEVTRDKKPKKEGDKPEKTTLVRLKAGFSAIYRADKSLFRFDASLYDSEVLGIDLSGDVALRLRGGNQPYFMLSVGGLFPDFKPPKGLGLPDLKRITISLKPDFLDIDIGADFYVALTSNTVQFGVSAWASYNCWAFGIEGDVKFDALFQFRPIYFIAIAEGGVTLRIWRGSIGLRIKGTIEGPYPLRFSLYVSIKVLWWWVDYDIPTFSIGSEAKEQRPTLELFGPLLEALRDNRSWQPVLPAHNNLLVAIRDRSTEGAKEKEEEKALFFHPIGGIRVDQEKVPLNLALERFGHHVPALHNRFSLSFKDQQGEAIASREVRQFFAPAQYFALSNEEKLNRSSYEQMPSGIQVAGFDDFTVGQAVQKAIVYEDNLPEKPEEEPEAILEESIFSDLLHTGSLVDSALGKKQARQRDLQAEVKIQEEEYAIALQTDADPDFQTLILPSETEAQHKLQEILSENPALEDQLEVIPAFELNEV